MGMKSSMYALMALTLGGAMAGGNLFGENTERPVRWEDLSPEEQERLIAQHRRKEAELRKEHAIRNGLKEFEFIFNYGLVKFYALNQKSANKKARKLLLQMVKEQAELGLDYPKFQMDKGVDISGTRKMYEENKLS